MQLNVLKSVGCHGAIMSIIDELKKSLDMALGQEFRRLAFDHMAAVMFSDMALDDFGPLSPEYAASLDYVIDTHLLVIQFKSAHPELFS